MMFQDTTQPKLPILCIEDDADTCNLIEFIFEQEGWKIVTCERAQCLKVIKEGNFAAIILDNYFGELSGIEICEEIRKLDQKTPVVFFSGESRSVEMSKAKAAGADDYLVKPNDFEKLLPTTLKLIEQAYTSENFMQTSQSSSNKSD
jgi:DNA-binding response OmpR family regulator